MLRSGGTAVMLLLYCKLPCGSWFLLLIEKYFYWHWKLICSETQDSCNTDSWVMFVIVWVTIHYWIDLKKSIIPNNLGGGRAEKQLSFVCFYLLWRGVCANIPCVLLQEYHPFWASEWGGWTHQLCGTDFCCCTVLGEESYLLAVLHPGFLWDCMCSLCFVLQNEAVCFFLSGWNMKSPSQIWFAQLWLIARMFFKCSITVFLPALNSVKFTL